MSNLLLPLAEIPAVIRESTRQAFKVYESHGYKIVGPDGKVLDDTQLTALFREFGNNAGQALFCIDKSDEDA